MPAHQAAVVKKLQLPILFGRLALILLASYSRGSMPLAFRCHMQAPGDRPCIRKKQAGY